TAKFIFTISSRFTECLTRIVVKREEFLTIYIHCLTDIKVYSRYPKVKHNLFDSMNASLTKVSSDIQDYEVRKAHDDDDDVGQDEND
ncbi:unnamed protein product, partial [Didymodactylos carnosus]